jgi:hypothetical protein
MAPLFVDQVTTLIYLLPREIAFAERLVMIARTGRASAFGEISLCKFDLAEDDNSCPGCSLEKQGGIYGSDVVYCLLATLPLAKVVLPWLVLKMPFSE